MNVMTPAEASRQLSIQPSTLRKYSLLLENNGFVFARNLNNSRKYNDMDIVTLQELITLLKTGNISVEDAAYTVYKRSKLATHTADNSDGKDAIHSGIERHSDDIATALIVEVNSLRKEIEEQRNIIDGFRLSQEKRDSYFIEILEELQGEIHKLNEQSTALSELPEPEKEVAHEPVPVVQEQKKGFWARVFNK